MRGARRLEPGARPGDEDREGIRDQRRSQHITVAVAGKDMTFNVDVKTTVVARGAGTKAKAAEAAGKTGPGVAEVLKAGDAVEVVYHEAGMHADTVRGIASVPPPPPPPAPKGAEDQKTKAATESGVVSAVSGTTLTIKGKAGETTFTVDGKTVVSGTGFGTAGRRNHRRWPKADAG